MKKILRKIIQTLPQLILDAFVMIAVYFIFSRLLHMREQTSLIVGGISGLIFAEFWKGTLKE